MAFESVNYQCPACGGPLHFASAEQKLVCDYCDSRFEVEEVEALYRERQDKADAKADAAAATPKPVADDAVQELAQNAGYICSSCGAELVSDGTVAVTTCPYCGNSAVAPGQLSGDFSPDLVIPFKLGRDDVTAALKEHYKGKILLPKSFVTGNHIDEVQGVYVPFWLYGARVDGEVYFDATNETVTEESDRTVTTTDHYDAYRKGNISFKRVPVDGSSKMPDGHMDAIEPFDYDALRPFSVAYMPGYIANRYDEDCETCKARAERRMEESTISALRETVVDEYERCHGRKQAARLHLGRQRLRPVPRLDALYLVERQELPVCHERPDRPLGRRAPLLQAQARHRLGAVFRDRIYPLPDSLYGGIRLRSGLPHL